MIQFRNYLLSWKAVLLLIILLASISMVSCKRSQRQKYRCRQNFESTYPCSSYGRISNDCMSRFNHYQSCVARECYYERYRHYKILHCSMVECHDYGDEFNSYSKQGLNCYNENDDDHYSEYNGYLDCVNNNPYTVCSRYDSGNQCDDKRLNAYDFINECHQYYRDSHFEDCMLDNNDYSSRKFFEHNVKCWKKDEDWNTSFDENDDSSSGSIHFSMRLLGVLIGILMIFS